VTSCIESVESGVAEIGTLKKIHNEKDTFSEMVQVVNKNTEGISERTLKTIETRMKEVETALKQVEEMTVFIHLCQHVASGKKDNCIHISLIIFYQVYLKSREFLKTKL